MKRKKHPRKRRVRSVRRQIGAITPDDEYTLIDLEKIRKKLPNLTDAQIERVFVDLQAKLVAQRHAEEDEYQQRIKDQVNGDLVEYPTDSEGFERQKTLQAVEQQWPITTGSAKKKIMQNLVDIAAQQGRHEEGTNTSAIRATEQIRKIESEVTGTQQPSIINNTVLNLDLTPESHSSYADQVRNMFTPQVTQPPPEESELNPLSLLPENSTESAEP